MSLHQGYRQIFFEVWVVWVFYIVVKFSCFMSLVPNTSLNTLLYTVWYQGTGNSDHDSRLSHIKNPKLENCSSKTQYKGANSDHDSRLSHIKNPKLENCSSKTQYKGANFWFCSRSLKMLATLLLVSRANFSKNHWTDWSLIIF